MALTIKERLRRVRSTAMFALCILAAAAIVGILGWITDYLLKLGAQYHLLATGGSDFHGSVKPGQGLGSVFVPWDAVTALLEAVDQG